MRIMLLFLGAMVIIATALSLLRKDAWWIRLFDFPRAQILGLALGVLILYAWGGYRRQGIDIAVFFLVLLALAYQAYRIFPYTPLAGKQVQAAEQHAEDSSFSLLVTNVQMRNRQADRLYRLIQANPADLVLAVETDRWWAAQLTALLTGYPFRVAHVLENTYGMMLFSRFKLLDPEVRFLIQNDIPSIHTGVELPCGQRFHLHCLHPRPPWPEQQPRSTERDAELVLVGRAVKDSPRPVVVAGDLNDVAWSVTTDRFQRLSGLLDPRTGRGLYSTFHARYPGLRWPLDHIFHSSHWRLRRLKRLPYWGSDHFPILITLSLEPTAVEEQQKPHADRHDSRVAARKIARAQSVRQGSPTA